MQTLKGLALLLPLSALILVGLNGCGGSPIATDSFCDVASVRDEQGRPLLPLSYSSKEDSKETRDGIDRVNGVWLCKCGEECPG